MTTVEIVEYQPVWVCEFNTIGQQLRSALGEHAIRIDHIGSTSVPNLAAKDIIDVQVSVANLDDEAALCCLANIGYRLAPQRTKDNIVGMDDNSVGLEKFFFLQPLEQRRSHIHVREMDRVNQIYPLLFRDYLRVHESTRRAYQKTKVELAKKFPNDIQSYYAIKDPYMDTIYQAALAWSDKSGWQPDPNFL